MDIENKCFNISDELFLTYRDICSVLKPSFIVLSLEEKEFDKYEEKLKTYLVEHNLEIKTLEGAKLKIPFVTEFRFERSDIKRITLYFE